MKVLYFLTKYPFYSETFIAAEISQLREAGHIPVICNFTFANTEQRESKEKIINNTKNIGKLLAAIVKNAVVGDSLFFSIPFWKAVGSSCIKNPRDTLKYLYMILSADYILSRAKEENADMAVNHFLFKSTLAGSFISRKLKVPYHLRLHTKRFLYTESLLVDILHGADKITAIATDVKNFYELKMKSNVSIGVVRQSVNVSFLTQIERAKVKGNKILIVAIGRLIRKKGFDQLVKAFSLLPREVLDRCKLNIYGEGPERSSLQKSIEEHRLIGSIELQGKRDHTQLMLLLSQASLLAVPSIEIEKDIDGIPTVIIESMLVKTPVLAYDTASISEIVLPQKTGFLVPEGDIEKLSKQLSLLIQKEELRDSVIHNAFEHAMAEYKHTLAQELKLDV